MNNIEKIIEQFETHPGKALKKHLEAGKKVVGIAPVHAPAEIVYAADMVPMGIWGSQGELNESKKYFPAFYCAIVQRTMEMGLNGMLDDLSAVMIPTQCDSLKALGQNFKRGVKNVEYIHIANAQNRKLECGLDFNEIQYKKIKEKLEEISGNEITDEKLENAIKVFNEQKRKLQEFSALSAKYPNIITPAKRSRVMKAMYFMDRVEHTELLASLISELEKEEVKPWNGAKVVTTGIINDSKSILDILEENNIAIVDDEVAHESRQFRTLADEGTDNPLRAIAKLLSDIEGCSVLFDPEKKRSEMIVEKVKASGADGVLFLQTKFCDPEEFDYPIFKKALEKAGIRYIMIETDQQMTNYEQARTSLQTFAEML